MIFSQKLHLVWLRLGVLTPPSVLTQRFPWGPGWFWHCLLQHEQRPIFSAADQRDVPERKQTGVVCIPVCASLTEKCCALIEGLLRASDKPLRLKPMEQPFPGLTVAEYGARWPRTSRLVSSYENWKSTVGKMSRPQPFWNSWERTLTHPLRASGGLPAIFDVPWLVEPFL